MGTSPNALRFVSPRPKTIVILAASGSEDGVRQSTDLTRKLKQALGNGLSRYHLRSSRTPKSLKMRRLMGDISLYYRHHTPFNRHRHYEPCEAKKSTRTLTEPMRYSCFMFGKDCLIFFTHVAAKIKPQTTTKLPSSIVGV